MTNRSRRSVPVGLFAAGIVVWGLLPLGQGRQKSAGRLATLEAQKIIPGRLTDKKTNSQTSGDTWQVIQVGNQRIGYSRATTKTVTQNHRQIIRSTDETHMTIKRFGQNLRIQSTLRTDETTTGEMLSFELQLKNPPASTTRTVGRVEAERLVIETTIAGRTTRQSIDWEADVKSPAYQDRWLREHPLKPRETRSFKIFLPEFNKVTKVILSADDYRYVKLFDGKARKLLKVRVTQAILPTLPIRAYLDADGKVLKTETDFLGKVMITYAVPKEEALKAIAGAELDIAVNTLVRVRPIRNAHRSSKIVYLITTPGEDPAKYLVSGWTQQIKKLGPEQVELTVTAAKMPSGSKRVKAQPQYLQATRFLQSADTRVIEHARKAAAGESNPARIASRMERYVHEKLTKKNFSTALASAAEVAKTMQGDCTEHAVLLAAMLRAEKIPSRIAVGLVYIERHSAFGGHMWTEALLDGKWIPLDATLGEGGIGAAHIKLAESSFADDAPAPVTTFLPLLNILGKMKIEVIRSE